MPTASRPLFLLLLAAAAAAQTPTAPAPRADLGDEVRRYAADLQLVERRYDTPLSAAARAARRSVLDAELAALAAMDFDVLSRDARIDWHLLRQHATHELALLAREAKLDGEAAPLLAFAGPLVALHERWRALDDVEPEPAAAALAASKTAVAGLQQQVEQGELKAEPALALHAVQRLDALRRALGDWARFYLDYDPQFTFWCAAPWREFEAALGHCRDAVQGKLVERGGDGSLCGVPIGHDGLRQELLSECIASTPQQLLQLAEDEFAVCDREMLAASKELGCGDDWKQALEQVKQAFVPPGRQPALIRDLAREAVDFLEQRQLLTIPELCKDGWRMRMMSPAAQRVNPFFLGGEVIQVSFPTAGMSQDEKLQSLRSNNEHFARATVHHELIPGHWLQQYVQARHRSYRQLFATPFWIEGWALYWELRLYELGFARNAADKVGMLYWRKHRCARIVFSLRYHLGEWTPQQCIDYLIERVGHEPAAAEGEVRRSISGGYGPLYQCAYMLGGLQLRALQRELVGGGKLGEREFHDAVLQQNAIPIALVGAALRAELPGRELPGWTFR